MHAEESLDPVDYRPFRPQDAPEVDAFLSRVAAHTGSDPLSEHKWIRRLGGSDARITIGEDGDRIKVYAQAAAHPGETGTGVQWGIEVVFGEMPIETGELGRCLSAVGSGIPRGDEQRLWAPTSQISEAAERLGLEEIRTVYRLRRRRSAQPVARPVPRGFELQRFNPKRDADEWLRVNNAAFAGHPENGALTRSDLDERLAQPWFDPAGFLVARSDSGIGGFCWTKVHDDGSGEIYIIAVAPWESGAGLGRWLLEAGLEHLEQVDRVSSVILYVEGDNERALGLYESVGFEREKTIRQFAVVAAQPNG